MQKMEVHRGYINLRLKRPVITMGVFDGVHRGHRMLLDRVVREAKERDSDAVAVTFDPHPRMVLSGDPTHLRFLTDIEERTILLRNTGIDHLVIIDFTHDLSQMTASEFLSEVLSQHLGVNHLVTGFDHHFGKRHEGTSDTIMECSERLGFTVTREKALTVDGKPVSSSSIRHLLMNGDAGKAAELLGYNYFVTGAVVAGRRIGRDIGFPTANIEPLFKHKLIPADGVYAVEADIEGVPKRHAAMVNIGTRPTIREGDGQKTIEAHIIDFEGDLYHNKISLHFIMRLRDEMKFASTDALADQLRIDRVKTLELLGR